VFPVQPDDNLGNLIVFINAYSKGLYSKGHDCHEQALYAHLTYQDSPDMYQEPATSTVEGSSNHLPK